jgi:translation initiation factor IF-1
MYLLPVKTDIRKRTRIKAGDLVTVRTSFFLHQ